MKEPPPTQQADSTVKERDNRRGIVWLRGQGSNPELLLQSQAWYLFHHLASIVVWTERLELSNPRLPTPVRSHCATSRWY